MTNDPYLSTSRAYQRWVDEYEKYGSLVIGYDFDDTVHDYHKKGHEYPEVIRLLRDLKEIGCKLICWTAHPDTFYVEKYLYNNNIPYDGINEDIINLGWSSRKPFFNALLDDRAGLTHVYVGLNLLVQQVKSKKQNENSTTITD